MTVEPAYGTAAWYYHMANVHEQRAILLNTGRGNEEEVAHHLYFARLHRDEADRMRRGAV